MSRGRFRRRRSELLADYQEMLELTRRCELVLGAVVPERIVAGVHSELIALSGAGLVESRKGARVSERSGYSSGRSYRGVRVGPVYVGGSSGSHSSSTTVSYSAPDELRLIDEGVVTLTTRHISFVGSQFTRTTEYRRIVDFERRGRQVLIAPANATRVHILNFEEEAEAFVVSVILAAGKQHRDGRLDAIPVGIGGVSAALLDAIELARDVLAGGLDERRDALKHLIVTQARAEGQPVVPIRIPAPSADLLARIPEDRDVRFLEEASDEAAQEAAGSVSTRSGGTALLLSIFFGIYGADRFYLGYGKEGLLKLLTAGGLGFLWIRDILLLINDRLPDVEGRTLAS